MRLIASGAGLVVLIAFAAACEPPPPAKTVPGAWVDEDSPPPPAKLGPWAHFDALDELQLATTETQSEHFGGGFSADISVNVAAAAYGTFGREPPFQEGALIVEALRRGPDAPPEVYFAMEKREPGYHPRGGDWHYSVIDRNGQLQAAGELALCARCHAEAPREHVFEVQPCKDCTAKGQP